MKFNKYHKIVQFKDVIRDISYNANYKGINEKGEAIYENSKKPTIKFKGTVKLHGTNALITYHPNDGIKAGKRSSLLAVDQLRAHFNFNQFVQVTRQQEFLDLMDSLWNKYCKDNEQITLYGEWAGNGVQKSVGISLLPKAFYIFDCKIYNIETEEFKWIDVEELKFDIEGVYNINDFETYSIDIDFNNPGLIQNTLVDITTNVEKECPVSKKLIGNSDVELVGEGVVWTSYYNGQKYIFKVKGHKHSVTKVKTLANVNPELIKSIIEFVDYACTENRIEQGIKEVNATEKKDIPNLLKWVANDIITEENDVLQANNLEWKQVARDFSTRVRQYYFKKLETV